MLQKHFLILLVAFSFLFAGCAHKVKASVYVSNPEEKGMDFYNSSLGTAGFVDYSKTDKFICLDPNDSATILNLCGVAIQNSCQ